MTDQEQARIDQIRTRAEPIFPTPCVPMGASSLLHDVPRAVASAVGQRSAAGDRGPFEMRRDYGEFFGHAKQDIEFLLGVIERQKDALAKYRQDPNQLGWDFDKGASMRRASTEL